MIQIEIEIDSKKKSINLDTEEQTCQPYGFLSGERIVIPGGGDATVLGVGLSILGADVLWYLRDENGKPGFWSTAPFESKDLREQGFRLVA